jgi:hypothetical protein
VEWIRGVILMTNEDKEDCLTLLNQMKEFIVYFKSTKSMKDPTTVSFVYAMDQSTDVLVEIIENKPLDIERMFL